MLPSVPLNWTVNHGDCITSMGTVTAATPVVRDIDAGLGINVFSRFKYGELIWRNFRQAGRNDAGGGHSASRQERYAA